MSNLRARKIQRGNVLRWMWAASLLSPMSCVSTGETPISHDTVAPGGKVRLRDKEALLYPGRIQIGQKLQDAAGGFDLALQDRVTVISLVPSVDTRVCEQQTHILSGDASLSPEVDRVTLSRDLPMAQERFRQDNGMENVRFLSDYKTGAFGKSTGLMLQGSELITRGVIVLDREGVIRHLQIVPDAGMLPDMATAFRHANALAETGATE